MAGFADSSDLALVAAKMGGAGPPAEGADAAAFESGLRLAFVL